MKEGLHARAGIGYRPRGLHRKPAIPVERGELPEVMGMVRKMMALMVAAAAALVPAVAHAETVKLGTLAPAESPWGKAFKTWQKAVKERSGGALELTFYWNGQQGDEAAMVGKMKTGQLDGAAITAVGLGKIYKDIVALQLPGLFRSWDKLDKARDAMKGEFETKLKDAGFVLTGWGDVGLAHTMSKGFQVKTPDDLKGKHPYMWRDDPIAPVVFQTIGGVTPVPVGVPEVLPNLNSGAINVVTAPALAAEQLQWASRLDNMSTNVTGAGIGALVLTAKKLDSLPADQKALLVETGKLAGEFLQKTIRKEDDAAYKRLSGKMTTYELSPEAIAKWDEVFKHVRTKLSQGTFSPELVAKLEGLAK